MQQSSTSFGEGFADTLSQYSYDDPVIARDFMPNTHGRNDPLEDNCQYPLPSGNCTCEVHDAGQLLSGIWQRILQDPESTESFRELYGSSGGLEAARSLHVMWMFLTLGTDELCVNDPYGRMQSATSAIGLEVLAADDDDGNLSNGTPHHSIVCSAFASHGLILECPCDCP
jgi:hypothetical protein